VPAPRDNDLASLTYHRHTITYAGAAAALAGTAVDYARILNTGGVNPIFGVLESDAAPGETVSIAVAGTCQMISGAAVAVGAAVGVDGTSRAAVAAVGNQCFGRALTAATAAGQKIQVLITREGTN
jgi:Uncharacterized conserved protein (DUF2190)